jgi:hypothetical protein
VRARDEDRLAAGFFVALLAAPELVFAAPELLLAEPPALLALVFRALDARFAELGFEAADEDFERPPLLEDFGLAAELDPDERELAPASSDHLPLSSRWAASETASAIREPSLVALDTIDFAAFSVVSAASIPASRIALRALGLALIAAAAAARPAASISLLIAASVIFSAVDLPEDVFELELLLDFAIETSFSGNRHASGTTVPLRQRKGSWGGQV